MTTTDTTLRLDAAVYRDAEKMLHHNRSKMVVGAKVRPVWIDNGAKFWYRRDDAEGHQFLLVDPAAGTRAPAFDHDRLASALEAATGSPVAAKSLPFGAVEFAAGTSGEDMLEFDLADGHWRCALDTYSLEKVDDHEPQNHMEVRSPDKQWAVFHREHDLWVRNATTGEEKPLTTDGTADRSYGVQPDALTFGTLLRRFGMPALPPLVAWSPDSTRVFSHSTDQRGVGMEYLIESTPPGGGRSTLHSYHYAIPGDEVVPTAELFVCDVVAGTSVQAKSEPLFMPMVSPLMWNRAWWSEDCSAVYYLDQPRDPRTLSLYRLDPTNGDVRLLVEEYAEPRMEPGQIMGQTIIKVLSTGEEVLWYSQRDGWGHLYLYDSRTDQLTNRVTEGEWAVQEVLHVDEDERVVYLRASELVAEDPYRRQVCRVGLDGSGFTRLGDDDLDHVVTVPENKRYYLDSASTRDTPPVTTVRSWDGSVLVELERADVSALVAIGWQPPEPFCVKADDGVTDIYGVLLLPHHFDPTKKYAVIDQPYPGPQKHRADPSFEGNVFIDSDPRAMAALGFVVILVDGRGTPGRSKAFHDLSWKRRGEAGFLADHVAALRQLASDRPWMDLDRVGVYGLSGGAFATVRAMCTYPDFYKVGVATAGDHDDRYYHLAWAETYDGPLDPEVYARSANVEIADRLEGKLLLMHGEMDDNVHPQQTMRLVDKLIAANKDFDLVILPGAEHLMVGFEAYTTRRRWDFFVRHLMGIEPPAGYRIEEPSIDPTLFFEGLGG